MSLNLVENLSLLNNCRSLLLPIPDNDNFMMSFNVIPKTNPQPTIKFQCEVKIFTLLNNTLIKEFKIDLYNQDINWNPIGSNSGDTNFSVQYICEYLFVYFSGELLEILTWDTFDSVLESDLFRIQNIEPRHLDYIIHNDVILVSERSDKRIILVISKNFGLVKPNLTLKHVTVNNIKNLDCNFLPSLEFNKETNKGETLKKVDEMSYSSDVFIQYINVAPKNCIQLMSNSEFVFYNYKTNKYTINKYLCIKKISEMRYICYDKEKKTYTICEYSGYNECVVCHDYLESKNAIVPCGHTNLCNDCYININKKDNTCPTCRTPISNFMKLYM